MPPLDLTTEQRGDQLRVAIAGELDIVNSPHFEEELAALESAATDTLILDLRDVAFIDSTGLRALIAANERARSAGRRLVVVRGAKAVDRLLSLTQLDQRLEIVDDPDAVGARPVNES
ncbi:MAG TPA: STAS domain-containing protein [Solirubrobacterales bacterium]